MTIAKSTVVVIVATIGRPKIVTQTIQRILQRQTIKPNEIIISTVSPDDAGDAALLPGVRIIISPPGLAAQRNKAMSALSSDVDIIVFFDDDFVPDNSWLEVVAQIFSDQCDIVGITGNVIADGIKGPGFSFVEADKLLGTPQRPEATLLTDGYSPYGCNMAYRNSAVGNLRFDERLVLYGWLEDRDFGSMLSRKGGRLVKSTQARGVHLGVKSGRIAGKRLGYSQIINPIYLLQKRTMTYNQAIGQIFRNFVSLAVGSFVPEPYVDRRGRLWGNLIGIKDMLRGRIEPERARDLR